MKHAIASISYNRPEMLKLSLEYIAKLHGIEKADRFVFHDGPEPFDFLSEFNLKEVVTRSVRAGLSKNILLALKRLFEKDGYDLVTIIEDDFLLSFDFLDFTLAAHVHKTSFNDAFTISGFSNTKGDFGPEAASWITLTDWYFTGGVTFDRKDYALIEPHISDAFFDDRYYYLKTRIRPIVEKGHPKYCAWQFEGGEPRHPEQAGLINDLRAARGLKQMTPIVSRCQNIGYYGFHQIMKKPDGSDVRDPENWKRQAYYNPTWKESHEWDCLSVIDSDQKNFEALRDITPR